MVSPRAACSLLLFLAGLAPAGADGGLQVAVSLEPQAFLVDRIGGGEVRTVVLVGPSDNEATYAPTPGRLAALEQAAVWFTVGVPFEKVWQPRIEASVDGLEVVNLAEGLPLRRIEGGAHAHDGEADPHTWTDPQLAARMAIRVGEVLARIDPANAPRYETRTRALEVELLGLHESLARRLAPVRGGVFIVFHPSWGYFADAYGLVQLPIESGGHEPGPRALAEVIRRGRTAGARAVFVQPQFSRRSAMAVAEALGAEVLEADPLARDYVANLRAVGERVAAALAPQEPSR